MPTGASTDIIYECGASFGSDVRNDYKRVKAEFDIFSDSSGSIGLSFQGFRMIGGIAKNREEAMSEIINNSECWGPALGKLYYISDRRTTAEMIKMRENMIAEIDGAKERYLRLMIDYNKKLCEAPLDSYTQCASCKSSVKNEYIHKFLDKCIICDESFQSEYMDVILKKAENQINNLPHVYGALWGGKTIIE
tara:strand:+ start:3498 stop:4076 length:579 start_codon:yes stop_codon:yes gene_type:complete